jgi:uncharacterized protein YkwD
MGRSALPSPHSLVSANIRAIRALMTLSFLAGCTNAPRHPAQPADFDTVTEMAAPLDLDQLDLARLATAIFNETNEVRRQLGLRRFGRLKRLDEAADLQATTDALNQTPGHTNMVTAWATPFDRVKQVGLTPLIVSENAAILPFVDFDFTHGYTERIIAGRKVIFSGETGLVVPPHTYASFARAIVRAWMNSPHHRANIVNPSFRYLGCSARPSKSITGLDMIAGIQDFYTPAATP